jgi:hypothetical protein
MKRLIILSSADGASEDENLSAFASLMGIPTAMLPLSGNCRPEDLRNQIPLGACSLALHDRTLRHIHGTLRVGTGLQQLLGDNVKELFIYGASAAAGVGDPLLAESDGAIYGSKVQVSQTCSFAISGAAKELCPQLMNQSFRAPVDSPLAALEVRQNGDIATPIMLADEHPVFIRVRGVSRDVFIFRGRVPDIGKQVHRQTGIEEEYPSLLPVLIFLRHCFSETCWRGAKATARLIIDDPLLAKRYGALDFETLKASMNRFGYGTSIAFIPWNYWRTSRRLANTLLGGDSNLTICTHGCDHTNREFASGDAALLKARAAIAMQRMKAHQKRIRSSFEDVMVFPQGYFAKASIPALRSANFLAAVNGGCFPTDSQAGDLKVADLLWPAVTRFDGFPIFHRRLPRHVFDCAVDLFLGKPALLVEHHEYFRDHCRAIEEFIVALQKIEHSLSWPDLTTQLTRSHLRRRLEDQSMDVRFFTRRFQLISHEGDACRYRLSKVEPEPRAVEKVLVNGSSVPFGFENGFLVLETTAEPGQGKNLEILYAEQSSVRIRSFGIRHHARVLVRRALSEFRDNTLSRHKELLKVATRIVKAMKATGES